MWSSLEEYPGWEVWLHLCSLPYNSQAALPVGQNGLLLCTVNIVIVWTLEYLNVKPNICMYIFQLYVLPGHLAARWVWMRHTHKTCQEMGWGQFYCLMSHKVVLLSAGTVRRYVTVT